MSKLSSKPPNTRVHGALFVISGTRGHKLVVSWPEKNLKSADDQVIGGFDAQFLADMLSPKAALCNQRFQLSIDELLFLGHPVLTNSITPLRAQSQSEIASMSMFHFVVVLDNDSDIAWVNQIYEQIVVRTVCAWRFEQLRCGYITREVELSLKATDISPGNSKGCSTHLLCSDNLLICFDQGHLNLFRALLYEIFAEYMNHWSFRSH